MVKEGRINCFFLACEQAKLLVLQSISGDFWLSHVVASAVWRSSLLFCEEAKQYSKETCTSPQRVIEYMHTFFHSKLLKNISFGHSKHAELVWQEIMK